MDTRIRSWRCPECGAIVTEADRGYPWYGDLCEDCRLKLRQETAEDEDEVEA